MSDANAPAYPEIRRLWRIDRHKLVDHFETLGPDTRRLRFGGMVSDQFVAEYADKILSGGCVVLGAFPDGDLRGVAELRGLRDSWPRSAEVALSVEPEWQSRGIGEALLIRLIAASRNRGIQTLRMLCLRENNGMRRLALKQGARLEIDIGNVEATLATSWPTPLSVWGEMIGDTRSYWLATLDLAR